MDPFRNPPADSLAAARLHVQALTECGLSREALLRALLENYGDGDGALPATTDAGFPQPFVVQPEQQAVQGKMVPDYAPHAPRLSVSTTSSKSSGRASIMSTATSMSSVSSQGGGGAAPALDVASPLTAPPAPPAPPVKSSNRGSSKPQGAYWCTFCDVAFQRKFDWKRHEDEFHERYKRYPCPSCNRIFWGANTFNQHHKNAHGCTTCPHADRVVRYTHRKTAWACGFCGGFIPSRDRYFDHVARHYEDGCNKSHWNHSLVIYGLLHQPAIIPAWKDLDAELYGHLPRNQQPMLEWDPKSTGHAQGFLEGEAPGKLQDLLEFFSEGRDDPSLLARLAHDSATIRLRHEVQPSVAPVPSPASSHSRPFSEPPTQKSSLKSPPLAKHMSTPQPAAPPPPLYEEEPMLKKHRNIAPLPSTAFPKNNPFFDHPQQQPDPTTMMSPFAQQMMATQPSIAPGGYYDLSVTHVHPHMQLMSQMPPQHQHQQDNPQEQPMQQQIPQHPHHHQPQIQQQQQSHLLAPPMNTYDDWSSLAGTMVDDSVFTSAMALGWQADMDMRAHVAHHPGPGTGS